MLILSKEDPFTLALMLGNIYYFLPKGTEEDKQLIASTLIEVKKKLNTKAVQALWDIIINFAVKNKYRLSTSHKNTLKALNEAFIQDIDFIKQGKISTFMQWSSDAESYREAFIALIRRHLQAEKIKDPFLPPKFSYPILNQAGAKQNAAYLSKYIKQCGSLPKKTLTRFASKNEEIAKLMMLDFADSDFYFEFSAKLADSAPRLRAPIAAKWRHCAKNLPLTSSCKKEVTALLTDLEKKYPNEFSGISINRESRAKPRENVIAVEEEAIPLWQHLIGAGIGSTGVYVGLACMAAPPIAPVVSLFFSASITIGALATPVRQHIDRMEINVRRFFGFR